jgi:mono/diheme cytochrome c family protein
MTRSLLRNRGVRLLTRAVRMVFANHDRQGVDLFHQAPRACLWMALLLPIAGAAGAADQTSTEQSSTERGHAVYQKWCTPCHGTGPGRPGTTAAAAHGIKPAVLEERQDLTPKMIETAVRKGVNFMPRFRKTEITDTDLAVIVAYLVHK